MMNRLRGRFDAEYTLRQHLHKGVLSSAYVISSISVLSSILSSNGAKMDKNSNIRALVFSLMFLDIAQPNNEAGLSRIL